MVNFSKFDVLTVTARDSLYLLLATASALVPNVSNLKWTVICDYPSDTESENIKRLINGLSCNSSNKINFFNTDGTKSVSAMKMDYLTKLSDEEKILRPWWFNLDDDQIVSYDFLQSVTSVDLATDNCIFTFSVFDVVDRKCYPDYTDKIFYASDLNELIKDVRTLPYKRYGYSSHTAIRTDSIAAGAFMFPMKLLHRFFPVFSAYTEKGVRGYDAELNNLGIPIYWISGRGYSHLGVLDTFFNSRWSSTKVRQ